MSRYHLQARLFEGPLNSPVRNELKTSTSDDRAELEDLADELREAGWRVWLYEEVPATPGGLTVTGKSRRLHVIQEWREVTSSVGSHR